MNHVSTNRMSHILELAYQKIEYIVAGVGYMLLTMLNKTPSVDYFSWEWSWSWIWHELQPHLVNVMWAVISGVIVLFIKALLKRKLPKYFN